jgi:chromosome segregation ATPase
MRLSSALSKVSECERIIKTSEVREGEKDERISKLERDLQTALASIADFKSRLEASLIAERDVSQTLEEERTSRAAEKSLSTRRHAALSSELSAAHADHSLSIDAMKRDAETRALQLSSSLDTLRSQLKAANEDAVLREESLKTTLERTSKTELESLKRQHACEVAELNTRCKEFEGTATNLSATLSSLEIQKEKGLAYVSSLQATLRAREHDLQALREEAEEELAAMDAQITASRADAEAALSRLTLIESRLVEARREADMHRSKAERLARSLSSEQGVGIGGGGTGGTLLGGFIEGEYGHVTLEAIDSKLKLLASEIETLGKERERLGTLLESIVRFIISRGLQLPKSLLTEFEELGNDTRLDNNKDEENEEEEEEVTSSSSTSSSLEYDDQELLSTVTSTTGVSRGGKAQRVKVRDDESKSTRTRRITRATTIRKKNVSRTEMTHDENEDEEEKEEIEDSLSGAESAQHASQSLLALAEMRNLIAARDTELASLRRKDAESSYLRLSLERQSQKLTDTVSELEAKLTRASLLHQRLMKALADADIQVLGSDTSFSIIQENEGEGEGGVFDLENNRQAFGIGKLHSGSDNNEDEFVPASTVFSSSSSSSLIFAPAPRRKEAAE